MGLMEPISLSLSLSLSIYIYIWLTFFFLSYKEFSYELGVQVLTTSEKNTIGVGFALKWR